MMERSTAWFLVLTVILLNSPLLTTADPVDPEPSGPPVIYLSIGGVLGFLVLIGCCVCICRVCCGCCRRDTHVTVVNAAPAQQPSMPVVIAPTIMHQSAPATMGSTAPGAPPPYGPMPTSDPGFTNYTYCPTAPPQPMQQPQAPWSPPPGYGQ
ncbi:unnamed protein product [Ixodes hexagonus]